jgi:CheY-like chemotaxis protein
MFSKVDQTMNMTLLSQLLNFLYSKKTTVIIDVSKLESHEVQICEKYSFGMFEFRHSEINENHEVILKNCKAVRDNLSIAFSLDVHGNITFPKSKNVASMTLHECKQVVMQHIYKPSEKLFSDIFTSKLEFIYYENILDISDMKIDPKYSMIVISAFTKDINGWQILPQVRRNFPFNKILFVGSTFVPAHQKVRAIKLGADKFLSLPIKSEELRQVLTEMYHYEDDENSKHLHHKILLVTSDIIKANKPVVIYKNTLFRFIKDFAFNMVKKGETIHFYKIYTQKNQLSELDESIKNIQNLVFISSFFTDNKQALFLIFKSLTDKEIKTIDESLEVIRHGGAYRTKDAMSMLNKEVLAHDVKKIAYPLDETNIDNVLEWVYYEN